MKLNPFEHFIKTAVFEKTTLEVVKALEIKETAAIFMTAV